MLKYAIPMMLASSIASAEIIVNIEDPVADKTYNGVRSIRGWAVSDKPIKTVYQYFNGELKGIMPYGGIRMDVKNNYPYVPNSLNSGFSATWNYALMDEGINSVKIVVTDEDGNTSSDEIVFNVNAFDNGYMYFDKVNIGQSVTLIDKKSFVLDNAVMDGIEYSLTMEWNVEQQNFSIIKIDKSNDEVPDNIVFYSNFKDESLAEINKLRAEGATCGTTWYPPVPPLTWHPILGQTALEHSIDMAAYNYFDHTNLDGESPWERVGDNGYTASGEVIAAGSSTVSGTINQWEGSAGHCAILMSKYQTEFGLGMAKSNDSQYGSYWTAMTN